jgi:hypothetical protein
MQDLRAKVPKRTAQLAILAGQTCQVMQAVVDRPPRPDEFPDALQQFGLMPLEPQVFV